MYLIQLQKALKHIEDVLKGKAEIENAMQNFIASNGLNLFVFLITFVVK